MVETFICSLCGHKGPFDVKGGAKRDDFACQQCSATVRYRDIGQLVLDEFIQGQAGSIDSALGRRLFDDIAILELDGRGPLRRRFTRAADYTCCRYWSDVEPGDVRDGIRCEIPTSMTFADDSFDLIVSLDTMSRLFEISRVIEEIARILKPGGVHIFSVPVAYPLPARTLERAKLDRNGHEIYNVEPRYHGLGDGEQAIFVNEFGRDLVETHKQAGLRLSIVTRSAPMALASQNFSFVARKIG